MLRIELQIEEGAIVFDTSEEITDSSETLKVELESLKDELVMRQNENDCLRDTHTSQRMEIETCVKQIKEIKSTNRALKADNANLKQRLYAKYYPTDGQIKAEKERDELQTRFDILEARKAEAIEHLRL